ncbi:peptidase [Actinomadura rubrobrunea]|uniref:Peptidase n=1 Tax=Actinomadura rubrobrunea TaxID=115335 RepID=A0A9W6PTA4_9ACTN|nr:alpha/beta hydrolase [Actinomadura rubrobrunea]GLW62653.1 peptidase [Actinomadura rubrobrunea]
MRRLVLIAAALSTGIAGTAAAASADTGAAARQKIAWTACPDNDPILGGALKGLECGTIEVPLDYSRPHGKKIKLALTRARAADTARYEGIVLLNRGGPGGYGRDLPARFTDPANGLPKEISARYDWIGFDPRGVAASEPQISCDPTYLYPGRARPDYVPADLAEEAAWVKKAKAFADSCGAKYGDTLRHITTKNVARDMDAIRAALGQRQTSYFGYSYGTYLGSVYASMFPHRVKRMVLDSVVRPSGVWYEDNLDQNEAFQKRAEIFFDWIADWDSVYHLGTTGEEVAANYRKGRDKIKKAPVDGKIGPSEYDDIFLPDGYRDYTWPAHARALADWVLRDDPSGLRDNFAEPAWLDQNGYAIYTSVECADAPWPRNWLRWHADHSRQYRHGATFLTWGNAWYNAPCAFWPVKSGTPQRIGAGADGPAMLILQPENDAATPLPGAYEVHRLFPTSRMVLELGGNNHGASISANRNQCMNDHVAAFLRDGTLPASRKGADAFCKANPAPNPTEAAAQTTAATKAATRTDVAVVR